MQDFFSKSKRTRIEEARRRTKIYKQALNSIQEERIDEIVSLELLFEEISYKDKKKLRKQLTREEKNI